MNEFVTKKSVRVFQLYVALKTHFNNPDFDFFTMKLKHIDAESLAKRSDAYYFYKLSNHHDPFSLLLSNLIVNRDFWIGDLYNNDKCGIIYTRYLKTRDSLTKTFTDDMTKLGGVFQDNLKSVNGGMPIILQLYQRGLVHIESLCILDSIFKIRTYWDNTVNDAIFYPDMSLRIEKTKPFVKFNRTRVTEKLLLLFGEQLNGKIPNGPEKAVQFNRPDRKAEQGYECQDRFRG